MGFLKKLISSRSNRDISRVDEESGLRTSDNTNRSYQNGDTSTSSGEDEVGELLPRQEQFIKQNVGNGSFISSMKENIEYTVTDFAGDVREIVIGTSRGPKRDMSFDQSNHLLVLLRMYGSVWPKVLPFCIANVIWTGVIFLMSTTGILDLTLKSSAAHNFMSTLVSFLVVSRSNITYARFMESRKYLEDLYANCTDCIQLASTFTMFDQSSGAKKWRHDLAYSLIVMLRTTIAVVDFQSNEAMEGDCGVADNATEGEYFDMNEFFHSERTTVDENFRAPSVLASKVRENIYKNRKDIFLEQKLQGSEEMALLGNVNGFLKSFQGIKKLSTTPFPFPLVQMTRWFLFAWIFTIPMTLTESMAYLFETMVVVFFITYGFLGIEYVSIELDDPYGDDPADFDSWGMAEIAFEDIYFTIVKADGRDAGLKLRNQVLGYASLGNALVTYRKEICRPSFWRREE